MHHPEIRILFNAFYDGPISKERCQIQKNNKTKKRVNIDKVKITNADNVCYISDGKVKIETDHFC